jgi:hypothetical protein
MIQKISALILKAGGIGLNLELIAKKQGITGHPPFFSQYTGYNRPF